MKRLITSVLLLFSAISARATGIVLFSDNFANANAWNITSGQLLVSNNIASTEGNSAMTTAFADFSQPLGSGDILQLTFNSNDVTNFATTGWAGVSLYVTGSEEIFIGSPGNMSSWGLDGPAMGSPVALTTTNEVAQVKFTYNYNTGAWTIKVAGETASGTIASGLAFDQIRIGADINNLADIAISNLNVVTNSGTDVQTTCASYTWMDGNTYSTSTFTAVYVATGQGAGGTDSIITLDLTIPQFQYGSGTAIDPYLVASKADLKILSETPCLWNKYFKQTADIAFTSADFQVGGDFYNGGNGFSPIGNNTVNFTGSYDGNEHVIQNLVISTSGTHAGFFGYVGSTATIQKLGLADAQVSSSYANGILCASNQGTISECFSSGLVSDNYYAGGLIGTNAGSVSNCYSTADVTNTIFIQPNSNSQSKSIQPLNQIQGSGGKGGLIGYSCSPISKCYSTGNLAGITPPVGGLVGDGCPINITNCFWDTQTSTMAISDGGTGKTTLQMQTQSTFTDSLWDFIGESANGTNDIWQMGGCYNNGYPVFSWQTTLAIPLITSVNGVTSCDDGSFVLNANASAGDVVWYQNQTGGSSIATGDNFLTPNLTANTSYWVEADTSGCVSSTRTEVVATIYDAFPDSVYVVASEICDSGATGIKVDNSSLEHVYYLINTDDNSVTDGPFAGNGGALTFATDTINTTTYYDVYSVRDFGMNLPAADDYVRFTSPFTAYGNEITIEAWINVTNGEFPWAGQSSAADDMNTNVWLWHAGTFYVNDNGGWKSLTFPTLQDGWVHIATVADANGLYIYYNGALVASNATGISTGIKNNASSFLDLGQDPRYPSGTAGRNSNNAFDNFRLWKVARTQPEIANNLYNCSFSSDANLVLNTNFENGSGTTITSQSGANGTLINPTSNNWIFGSEACPSCTASSSHTITVNATPSVDSLADVSACDSLELTALTVGGYFSDAGASQSLNTGDYVTSSQTLYIYEANGGCSDLDSFVVTINASPYITTSVSAETITANATGVTYQWIDCDNANAPISGETNQSFTATANGNYAVIVDNGNCADTSACVAITTVAINENDYSVVSVYPNPTQGSVVVTLGRAETVSIVLKNVLGQVVESKTISNSKQVELNIDQAAGVYFLELTNAKDQRSVIKIIKE